MGVDTCRVGAMGGALAMEAQERAPSQLSVELCVLRMSIDCLWLDSQARRTQRSEGCFRRMPRGTAGTPERVAASYIGVSGGVRSVIRWPRSSIPRASVRMRISWPPQPAEFSVWTIESGRTCAKARRRVRTVQTSARESTIPRAAWRGCERSGYVRGAGALSRPIESILAVAIQPDQVRVRDRLSAHPLAIAAMAS